MRLAAAVAAALALSCAGRPDVAPPRTTAPTDRAPARPPPGFEPREGERSVALDLDGDGRPDAWNHVVRGAAGEEVLVRREKDLDRDGRVDTWEGYAPDGTLARIAIDLDLDGSADETIVYEGDALARRELRSAVGRVPRTASYYEGGRLVRKERDANGDGRIDTWEHFEGGRVERIGFDDDGDGRADRWESRDAGSAPGASPAR